MITQLVFIKKIIHIAVFLIASCLTISALGASNACSKIFSASSNVSSADIQLDVLREKLWAVHATDHLFEGRLLNAGFSESSVRATTHFTLGELVPVHNYGHLTWEKKNYAVLTNIKHLEDKLVNLTATDTFILGSYELKPGDVVIIAKGATPPSVEGLEVITFDPNITSLRETITQTLKQKDAFIFNSSNFYLNENQLKVDGIDTQMADFLKPLLKEHPYLSSLDHTAHPLGKTEIHYNRWSTIITGPNTHSKNRLDWHIILKELESIASERDKWAHKFNFPEQQSAEYKRAKKVFTNLINVIQVEVILQSRVGKSILSSENKKESEMIFNKHSGDIESIIRDLQSSSLLVEAPKFEVAVEDPVESFIRHSRTLSSRDFSKMIRTFPEITESLGNPEFMETARALVKFKYNKIKKPNLEEQILKQMQLELDYEQFSFFHNNLWAREYTAKIYLKALNDPHSIVQIQKYISDIAKFKQSLLERLNQH